MKGTIVAIISASNKGGAVMRKKIVLMTVTYETSRELKNQLLYFLGKKVEVESYYIENMPASIHADLVVVSSSSILPQVKARLEEGVHIIVSRRSIDHKNIRTLVQCQPGSRALVVLDFMRDSEEFAVVLREAGLENIEFIPWAPGLKVPADIHLAVTPGKPHLVPSGITNVIDVGIRTIDLTTIVEILVHLDLLDQRASVLSSKFVNTLVKLYEDLFLVAEETTKTKEYLESIIDLNNDGVVVVDQHGKIIIFNRVAEQITGINENEFLGKHFKTKLPQLKLTEVMQHEKQAERMEVFGNENVVISYMPVFVNREIIGAVAILKDITEIKRLENEVRKQLKKVGHIAKYTFEDILGNSSEINNVKKIASKLARVDSAILITGESGVGKELFAQAIHNASGRKNGPFVAANFSAFTDSLLESELFGYEEGAFTGARRGGKPGLFELAHGGTIFLDEIGDANLNVQSRLLRVLQEKELMRVGGTKVRQVDVRIVAATNKDLFKLMRQGKFRDDLYYRLSSLPLHIPPLRERIDDIEMMMEKMLDQLNRKRKMPLVLDDQVKNLLMENEWLGNIRELTSVFEYLNAVVEKEVVSVEDLPVTLQKETTHHSTHGDQIDECVNEMVSKKDGQEYFWLLKELCHASQKGKGLGRRRLADALSKTDSPLTEQEVRTRLTELERLGCVKVRVGAGGTKVTSFGLKVFSHLQRGPEF